LTPKSSMPEVFASTTELSRAVSRALKEGTLRQLGPRVYTRNLHDPPELLIKRHLWPLLSAIVPGALIADRTAIEFKPSPDGSIFVVSDRKRPLELLAPCFKAATRALTSITWCRRAHARSEPAAP
jgi:hypothetical protein